ncbi:hypothetical protein ACIBG8_54420 [Nonomuraea sp. NPDC050556]|uniref:hypothetical protein n=1 Tax=Nonomuraea sp. NPDC050556 TaxID=3364369 RepID=UPI0037B04985
MAYVAQSTALAQILAYRLASGQTIVMPSPEGSTVSATADGLFLDGVTAEELPGEVQTMLGHIEIAVHMAHRARTDDAAKSELDRLTHYACTKCQLRCGEYVDGVWQKCRRCTGQGTLLNA